MAFCASRPAPIITLGLEVLVQEVIAAITTSPWPMEHSEPSSLARLLASASFLKVVIRCSAKLPAMPDSETRSCGRIGPAMQDSTSSIFSDSVSVKTGSGLFTLPELKLRTGSYGNFTRLVFDWPNDVAYKV